MGMRVAGRQRSWRRRAAFLPSCPGLDGPACRGANRGRAREGAVRAGAGATDGRLAEVAVRRAAALGAARAAGAAVQPHAPPGAGHSTATRSAADRPPAVGLCARLEQLRARRVWAGAAWCSNDVCNRSARCGCSCARIRRSRSRTYACGVASGGLGGGVCGVPSVICVPPSLASCSRGKGEATAPAVAPCGGGAGAGLGLAVELEVSQDVGQRGWGDRKGGG
jgi:hypothetical protein